MPRRGLIRLPSYSPSREVGYIPSVGKALPVTVTHTANAVLGTDLTTYTFSAQSLGSAFPGRKIVVGVGSRAGSAFTFSSVTIGGVAASVIAGAEVSFATGGGAMSRIALYQATVPTGATGDIVVTCSAATARCGIGVWSLANARVVGDAGTSTADPATDTLSVPVNGAAIGYGLQTHAEVGVTAAWTGITENFDEVIETLTTHTGASLELPRGGSVAVSCDWSVTPGTGGAACMAAFGT